MGLFGFGKKKQDTPSPAVAPAAAKAEAPRELVVYGTADGTRCRSVRTVLEHAGLAFKDVRVDDDLATRAWLERQTGDRGLPKVYVGTICCGGFEDTQALVVDGSLERLLADETLEEAADDTDELKRAMTPASIRALLLEGEILTVKELGFEMDLWAEPRGKPPQVYYEGAPHPIAELDRVVKAALDRAAAGAVKLVWKDED